MLFLFCSTSQNDPFWLLSFTPAETLQMVKYLKYHPKHRPKVMLRVGVSVLQSIKNESPRTLKAKKSLVHEPKCNWWWVCGSLAGLYQVKYNMYMIPVHLLFNVISGETRLCREPCVVWRVKLSPGFIIWWAEDGNNYLYCESRFFTGWCCHSGHITLVLLSLFSVNPGHASAFKITCELKGVLYTACLWPRLPLQRHFNLI